MRVRPPDPVHLKLLQLYSESVQKIALAARKLILEEAPEAVEFVYQLYTIADHFGYTDRPSDAFVFTTTHARWVNLGFQCGSILPDPETLLEGEGKSIRHVRLTRIEDLDTPGVRQLVRAAIADAERPEGAPEKPRTILRLASSARNRPARRRL